MINGFLNFLTTDETIINTRLSLNEIKKIVLKNIKNWNRKLFLKNRIFKMYGIADQCC